MPRFAYYERLHPEDQATYRRSDAISAVELGATAALAPLVAGVEVALGRGEPEGVEAASQALFDALTDRLRVPPVDVQVLPVRPRTPDLELHGLYDPTARPRPLVQVWMRTARHRRVVAFRTFLRTLVHELCHHLDYELYELGQSFHTEGFFKRESSLVAQLAGPGRRRTGNPSLGV